MVILFAENIVIDPSIRMEQANAESGPRPLTDGKNVRQLVQRRGR